LHAINGGSKLQCRHLNCLRPPRPADLAGVAAKVLPQCWKRKKAVLVLLTRCNMVLYNQLQRVVIASDMLLIKLSILVTETNAVVHCCNLNAGNISLLVILVDIVESLTILFTRNLQSAVC